MNKPNGAAAPESPAQTIAADQAASVDQEGMMADFHTMRTKFGAEGALQVLVLPGSDLRLMTFGLSKNQVVHMLATIIQSLALQDQMPGDKPIGDPVPPPDAPPSIETP